MSIRSLQVATGILAAVPVTSGLLGMMGLSDPLYLGIGLPRDATLDSNLRFYAGIWFGLGLAAFWLIPRITRESVLFRALWLMIFAGGLGRLISLLIMGVPFTPFVAFTVLEVIGAPIFIWWQYKVAQDVASRDFGA
jgi:Domain of unknown function (DUF4345)